MADYYVAISSTNRTGDTVVDGGGATYAASFTSLESLIADATYGARDLTADGDSYTIQAFADGSPYASTDTLTFGGYTCNQANFLTLEAAADNGHNGVYNAGVTFTGSFAYGNIYDFAKYMVIKGLRFQRTRGNASNYAVILREFSVMKECFVHASTTAAAVSLETNSTAISCVAYDSARGFRLSDYYSARKVLNCVAAYCSIGFEVRSSTPADSMIKNCVAIECTTSDYSMGKAIDSINNASSDATAPAGGTIIHNLVPTDAFIDPIAFDFHLKAGSALQDAGVDLSTEGVVNDFDGQPYTEWHIGADQPGQFTVPCIFNGVPVNTEIRIYKDSDKTELIGVELSTADPEQLDMPFTSTESAYAVLLNADYKYLRQESLSIGGSGIDLPFTLRLDRDYSLTSGMSGVSFNTTTKLISVTSANTFQDLYSYTKEQWKSDNTLLPHDFPFDAISAEAGIYEFIDGWDFDADTSRHNTRSGAWDTVTAKWMNVKTLGSATGQPYYTQGGLPADTERTDIQDTVIDITSNTTDFKLFLREQGKTFDEYDLITEQSIANLVAKTYFVPLANETDSNISASDPTIAANTPYTSMTLTYLDGAGFTTYADATVYPVNSVITDGTRWFITALGGTSNGATLAADTGVTDWIAYSGERDIDGTYYPFNTIFSGASGSKVQIYEKHQHMMRQATDITTGVRGDTADLLMYFLGDVLYTNQGCYIDGYQAGEQLDYRFTDSTGVVQQLPAPTVSLTINSNVSADIKIFDTGTQTVVSQATGITANTEVLGTYDITVMAQDYLPQRQTGKTLGSSIVTIDFELIADPIYNSSHGLAYTTDLTYNRTLKELTLVTRNAGRDIYSALIDNFISQSTLDNTPFDFQAVGIDSIFFLDDAVLAAGSEDNWFDAGIRYINSSDVVTAEWCSIKSSGTIPSGVTGRYQTGQGTGTTALRVSGAVNQIIQIYKTGVGAFDYRNYLVIKFQANPYIDTRSDILALAGVSTLEPFEYSVAIEPTTLDITVGTGGATLTLVDHTATPKVVGGKSFSYEIQDGGTATAEDILRTWDYNIAQAVDYLTYPSFNLPEFIAQSGTTYETRQGIVESEGDTLYGCYVSRAGSDHPDFTRHQSDDGTYYVAPVQVTVAMPNIIDGTRVYLYNEDTTSIMDNSIVSGGAGYAFSLEYTTDINVYYKICYQSGLTQKLPIRGNAIITSAGLTIVSTQVDDTIVNEYCASSGVDGSLVDSSNGGEITADFANVQIDVNDPDNIFDARKAVAWWRYICTTATGIAMYNPDALSFNPDIYNIGVDGALQVENVKASPLKVTGGIWLRDDGGDLIASTSNTIFWTPNDRVYSTVIETGVSGLTATESTKLDSINSSTAQLTFTNTNELDVNVKSNNDSPVYGSGTSTDKWRGEP